MMIWRALRGVARRDARRCNHRARPAQSMAFAPRSAPCSRCTRSSTNGSARSADLLESGPRFGRGWRGRGGPYRGGARRSHAPSNPDRRCWPLVRSAAWPAASMHAHHRACCRRRATRGGARSSLRPRLRRIGKRQTVLKRDRRGVRVHDLGREPRAAFNLARPLSAQRLLAVMDRKLRRTSPSPHPGLSRAQLSRRCNPSTSSTSATSPCSSRPRSGGSRHWRTFGGRWRRTSPKSRPGALGRRTRTAPDDGWAREQVVAL